MRKAHIPLKHRGRPRIQPVSVHTHEKRLSLRRVAHGHIAHVVAHGGGGTGIWHAQCHHVQRIVGVKATFHIKGHHRRILRADLRKQPRGPLRGLLPELLRTGQQRTHEHIPPRSLGANAHKQIDGPVGEQVGMIGRNQKPIRDGHIRAVGHIKGVLRRQTVHALRRVKHVHEVRSSFPNGRRGSSFP